MAWEINFTEQQAKKDSKKIAAANLENKVVALLDVLVVNPFTNPPSYEKLGGELKGYYSRRINLQHRLVYQVFKEDKIIKIIRMWISL